jgi:PKD repeat protein
MIDRISSLDSSYQDGDLSIFPQAIDSFYQLYKATNNGETVLAHSMAYNSPFIVVEDTSKFPDTGLVKIDDELIYYDTKTSTVFKNLKRGFEGSQQAYHTMGASVSASVMAEHHNTCKDAIYNIEHYVGTSVDPAEGTYNYQLTAIEQQVMTATPSFRAWPRSGQTPLMVQFKNISYTQAAQRFLWDFGDGAVSTDTDPSHEYLSEGNFTVQLRMTSNQGFTGIVTKNNYITIDNSKGDGFIYAAAGSPPIPTYAGTISTHFSFVDQTDGDIVQRHWNFGGSGGYYDYVAQAWVTGQSKQTVTDPDIHYALFQYGQTGSYNVNVLLVFSDQSTLRVNLSEQISVNP